ncbi:S8 family peptidase [Chitinophaga sp.]|uniref:S8 family peptidase n=1 Tax=Chitinophaga sp. TaxID=1869181 RepID=UPI0031D0410C
MRLTILFIFLLSYSFSKAQTPRYIIQLHDKGNATWSLDQPSHFLTARAIERRTKQHLSIDSTDLPVSATYRDSIAAAGNVRILYTSRWFNQVIIQTTDTAALRKIQSFPFVSKTSPEGRKASFRKAISAAGNNTKQTGTGIYGGAKGQMELHNAISLHDNNYKGQNMVIAVIDNGFPSVNVNRAFTNTTIISTWDFVNATANVYDYGEHGAEVLSILAANLPNEMIGSAPEAGYMLLRTEETDWEKPIEENNWVAAAEYADSMGADLISSSLGYNTFDDPVYNHTYADLDGKTTLIARAAALAAAKGMIVVIAAGNEGANDWHYILTPGDADSILTVGAVSAEGVLADFSGRGPAADGRIKPDVVSVGQYSQIVRPDGVLTLGSGTSFATPVIAGLTACLWQAFPNSTNQEVINAVRASSSQYTSPDNELGYGIPNYGVAFNTLLASTLSSDSMQLQHSWLKALPNPFSGSIKAYVHATAGQKVELALYDNSGRRIRTTSFTAATAYYFYEWPADFSALPAGIYYLSAQKGGDKAVVKLIKR